MIKLPLNRSSVSFESCPPERKPRVPKADIQAAVEQFSGFYKDESFFVADYTANDLRPVLKAFGDAGIMHEARFLRMDPVENCSGLRVWRLDGAVKPSEEDSDWEDEEL